MIRRPGRAPRSRRCRSAGRRRASRGSGYASPVAERARKGQGRSGRSALQTTSRQRLPTRSPSPRPNCSRNFAVARQDPLVAVDDHDAEAGRVEDRLQLLAGGAQLLVGPVQVRQHLAEGAGDDADGVERDEGVVVEFLGPQRRGPDDLEQLVRPWRGCSAPCARGARAAARPRARGRRSVRRRCRGLSHRGPRSGSSRPPRPRPRRRTPCCAPTRGSSRRSRGCRSGSAGDRRPARSASWCGVDLAQRHEQRRGADLPADVVLDRLHRSILTLRGRSGRRGGSPTAARSRPPSHAPGSRPARKRQARGREDGQAAHAGARRCRSAPSARRSP